VFCWQKENAVNSTAGPFANRTAIVVGEGFANSVTVLLATNYTSGLCQQLVLAVGKGTLLTKLACFAGKKAQLCQQFCPMLLAKLGNNFFPFILLFSCL
jgi:hypothetical protein